VLGEVKKGSKKTIHTPLRVLKEGAKRKVQIIKGQAGGGIEVS